MKRIIEKPILTEKMTAQSEKLNRYGFVVSKDANKIEIKKLKFLGLKRQLLH